MPVAVRRRLPRKPLKRRSASISAYSSKLLNVEGVFLVGVRRELVVGVAGQIVLAGKEGPNAPQLQNTFAAVQHGQLVRGHQLLAQLLVVGSVTALRSRVSLVVYMSMVSFPARRSTPLA